MISKNKQKKILEFQCDGKTPYQISQILKIDYKTSKRYCDKFRPEIENAKKLLSKVNFDENQSFLNKIPVIKNLLGDKSINGITKPGQ